MRKCGLSLLVASLWCACPTFAIDRDAEMINTAAVELMELDSADGIGVAVWGETAFDTDSPVWAILMKAGYGTISPKNSSSENYWNAAVGLKYYVLPETSVALVGDYLSFEGDRDAKMASLQGKHRFVPADEKISPYATASIGIRERSTFSSESVAEASFSETIFSLGGGVEFRMTEVLSFIFDAKYVTAEQSPDGTENLDGVAGFLGLQYYFFPEDK
ncbi:MAG: outer membrane beta-barrel protein [Verrucomicrobia bacterium]|nr:outer membrane beta-barrel protein [Verrucomicrobiota bacterium]